jgi:predicted pyridoxine 5'-phosphate oxidase superfamily flavin-nucleotide-binding protein
MNITEEIRLAWENHEGPVVLTTVDPEGVPNAIYATCVSLYDDETIVVADNYFNKTKANISSGSCGSILFITKDGKSYQVKGEIQYLTSGEIFEDMKRWNPERHPGHAAAVIKVDQVYSGARRLI